MFVGGLANVAVKSWPPEKFAEVVAWLQSRKIPVLLLAHADEAAIVDQVGARAAKLSGTRPAAWLGKNGELPLLAALLKDCEFYVGLDTGAMHLAAAVGRPVVAVFGGGHWPRFRPSARQAVSVVQPLPCFGCNWDCHFGDGPCVKTIPASDVIKAVERILGAGKKAIDAVLESHALPPEAVKLIADSEPGILALKRDRVDRQHKIEELKDETDSKDVEIEALKRAAEERKTEMEAIKAELEQECADKDKEIDELKAETNSKDLEMGDLKRAAEERKTEMEAIKAELEQECADKDKEIDELKGEADTKDAEIAALKDTCNDREQIVIRLDAGLKAHLAAAAARDQQIAQLETERADLAARLKLLAYLPPDAALWAQGLHDKDVHIANIETMVRERDREIEQLRQSIANYASGYGGIEQAKHYGRLLAEKEAVIQELHRTCVEREAVINELAAEATSVTAKLRKLWIAGSAAVRAKLVQPLRKALFRSVVEDYWMQIGVLRQYEPRPISWDPRIVAPSLKGQTLPKLGVVTPSYGQPAFLESTMVSILNQNYPKLLYVVQDGGSQDASPEIIARYAARLSHWASEPDKGQADAIRKGFSAHRVRARPRRRDGLVQLGRPRGAEGSWLCRRRTSRRIPGSTWSTATGSSSTTRTARSAAGSCRATRRTRSSGSTTSRRRPCSGASAPGTWPAGSTRASSSRSTGTSWRASTRPAARIVRLPYFLGCFRVHAQQKTSQVIHTTGADEMARIRLRFHGTDKDDAAMIERHARRIRFRGALSARLTAAGIRW